MLDLLGSILIIGGMTGFGFLYLEKEKKRMDELGHVAYLFMLLKSEVSFKKQPLPCACRTSGEKLQERIGKVLKEIADEMDTGRGGFKELWKEKWKIYLRTSFLSQEEQKKVLNFSGFIGYEEESMQENMMEQQVEEFTRLKDRVREELEKKRKVVLTLSSCMGILFVLILL